MSWPAAADATGTTVVGVPEIAGTADGSNARSGSGEGGGGRRAGRVASGGGRWAAAVPAAGEAACAASGSLGIADGGGAVCTMGSGSVDVEIAAPLDIEGGA